MNIPQEPRDSHIINSYETKNLNKAAYLLCKGSTWQGCRFPNNDLIAIVILDNVNPKHVKEYWDEGLMVEFWTYIRMRKWIKQKIQQKRNSAKPA